MDEELEPRTGADVGRSNTRRFIKVSRRPDDDERIRREAALLQNIRHAGVVRFVAADTAAFPNVLITERVEGPSLAALGPLPEREIDWVLDEVAATLDDLHQLGVVHGAVAPEHILVPSEGPPVLCSFGYGGRIGDPAPPLPPELAQFAHPGRAEARLGPEVDLYALEAVRRSLPAVPEERFAAVGAAVGAAAPGPRLPLVVGALSGAALLLGVGVWGLSGRSADDRPGPGPALTTTSRNAPTTRDRPRNGSPRTTVGTTPGPETLTPDSAPGEAALPADGSDGTAGPPGGRSGADVLGSQVPRSQAAPHGKGAWEGSAWATPTHHEHAHPAPPRADGASGPAFSVLSAPPGSIGRTSTRERATTPGPDQPTTPTLPQATPPPAQSTSSSLSLPDPEDLSPQVSYPPPGSLPADVRLPAPEALAPPVSLPDESTLLP